jgi:predicted transposase YbfD/YdcC
MSGASGWEGMEDYGKSKQQWLEQFLELPNGIPSDDTFRRLFERLDPHEFQRGFQSWVSSLARLLGATVVAIDGKTHRGSYERNQQQSALQTVSAWASEHRLMLAQVKVESKSNEISAIPALLKLLDLSGCIITIDAMGTQKEIAQQIIGAKADYVLTLKKNHPTLYEQVSSWLEAAQAQGFAGIEHSYDARVEAGHHRGETRRIWCVPVAQLGEVYQREQWAGLKTVVIVERTRRLWNDTSHEVQFYLSSLEADAVKIGRVIRQHWGIENQLHWTLDVTFGEDSSRVRRGHGPENLGLLRRLALNVLNQEQSFKGSVASKRRRAGWNNDYLLKILQAGSL